MTDCDRTRDVDQPAHLRAGGDTKPPEGLTADDSVTPLVGDPDGFLSRWQAIQVSFVDEPSSAVREADSLLEELMQRLAESFASEHDRLEQQWSGGRDADTETLRTAFQRYRSFFNRLLAT